MLCNYSTCEVIFSVKKGAPLLFPRIAHTCPQNTNVEHVEKTPTDKLLNLHRVIPTLRNSLNGLPFKCRALYAMRILHIRYTPFSFWLIVDTGQQKMHIEHFTLEWFQRSIHDAIKTQHESIRFENHAMNFYKACSHVTEAEMEFLDRILMYSKIA